MHQFFAKSLSRIRPISAMLLATAVFSTQAPLCAQDAPQPSETIVRIRGRETSMRITEKFAKVIELPNRILRVDGHDPEVLRVTAVSPTQIRLLGLKGGVTNIVLVDENNQLYEIEVLVVGDARHVQAVINQLFPHASVQAVKLNGGAIVLRGWVTKQEEIQEIVEIAEEFTPNVKNQMKVGGVQQVLLKCRIMEVQRSKVRRMGMNFLWRNPDSFLVSTPGPITPIETLTVTGTGADITVAGLGDTTLTFGLLNSTRVFEGFLQALKTEGLLKIHAEPSLVTMNGHPANLLNGGEFPVVVPAGLGTVAIEWREFGVRLQAVPIILGDGRVRLEVEPEVSERDFSSAVTVDGTTVPGLTVRRTRTQVEMNFGETLIIAGLISMRKIGETQKVPLFGELPWIGAAFSRKQFSATETELVVMLTPEYVAPLRPGQVPAGGPGHFTDDPTSHELYFHNLLEVPKYGDECLGCELGVFPTAMGAGHCQQCAPGSTIGTPGMIAPAPPAPAAPAMAEPADPYDSAPAVESATTTDPGPVIPAGPPAAQNVVPPPPPQSSSDGPPGLIVPGAP